MVIVHYVVKGLLPYPIPSLIQNQYHCVKSSLTHDYYLGIGYKELSRLVGSTYTYFDSNHTSVYRHVAGTAPGLSDSSISYTKMLENYFYTSGAENWSMPSGFVHFSNKFDSNLSRSESIAFSFHIDEISYGPEWKTAYDKHEGIMIHFHAPNFNSLSSPFSSSSVTIQVANQSLWTKTFDC